ncbi:MAG: alpha/beta hydrolase [Candidatus Hydrogenedentota bacterium]
MNFQRILLTLISKLPGGLLVKISGGKPLTVAGRTLDPMLQFIRSQAMKQPPMSSFTPEQARVGMDTGLAATQPRPRQMETIEDVSIPGPGGAIPCRLLTPHGAKEPSVLIMYFHQGGCVIGNKESCEPFCTILANETKARVLTVGYRLAPEHPFPAAAEDALAAYVEAVAHADEWSIDPKRIIVAGDSAGAGLSTVISQSMRGQEFPQPFAQVLIYPWVEALADTESYREHEFGYPLDKATMEWFGSHYLTNESDQEDFRVSPMRNPDLKKLPRTLVYTAGFDPLRDEGAQYAEAMKAAGVNVDYQCFDHLTHSFTALGGAVPAALEACEQIGEDLRAVLSESRTD